MFFVEYLYFLTCILAVLLLFLRIFFRSKQYAKEINNIPGPNGVFYFGHSLRFCQLKTEDILPYITKEFKEWGPTLKFWYNGIPAVLISDVDDLQIVLCSKFGQQKGLLYELLKPWLGRGMLTSKGRKWKTMRKIITPTFHFSILREYVHVFTKNSKIMMDLLRRDTNKNCCILNNFITYCALDSIHETSMGKCVDSQTTKSENDYVKSIMRIKQIIVERLFSPYLYLNFVFMLSSLGRENSKLLKTLHGVTSKLIQERKLEINEERNCGKEKVLKSDRKKIPFLDVLIEKQKIHCFTDLELREEVDTVLLAGHDTTSTALNWCFFELGHNEEIQERVFSELEKIFEGSDRDPTYQDLMKMEYLKRVLQETLRLYPSAPVITRKFQVDIQLKNYMIPAQTEIVLVLYHIHRNPKIFPNPEVFDPDRFLSEAVRSRNPFAYIPFSAGPRNCIGQKYAMLQMLVFSSYILRKYKLKSLNSKESVKAIPDVILRPNVELKWKLTARS